MSLRELQRELDDLSGVKRTTFINDNSVLKVIWQGEPNDYSRELRQLRGSHPEVEHTEPPAGEPQRTADQMPIHYYVE